MHSVVRYVSLLSRVLDQHLEEVQAGLIVAQGLFGGLGVEHELAVILGVELHAEAERLILTLDRLDDLHTVDRRRADDGEVRALNAADRLVVPGGNVLQLRGADDLIEPLGGVLIDDHIVAGIGAVRRADGHSVRVVVGRALLLIVVGDILDERAAGDDGHHLLAAADRERRHVFFKAVGHEHAVGDIARGVDLFALVLFLLGDLEQ